MKKTPGNLKPRAIASRGNWEGETPAEPRFSSDHRLGGSLALPIAGFRSYMRTLQPQSA